MKKYAKKYALLIGIDEYHMLGQLKYCKADATAVDEALRTYWGFKDIEIALMTDGAKAGLLPLCSFIREQLKIIPKGLDLLVVGFWGHGFCVEKENDHYLCGWDARDAALTSESIARSELLESCRSAGAGATCVFLDCCQSQPLLLGRDVGLRYQTRMPALSCQLEKFTNPVAVLNSCNVGELAYGWDERKHGIFTSFLLDGIAKHMQTIRKLSEFISPKVCSIATKLWLQPQNPVLQLGQCGDISLPVGDAFTTSEQSKPPKQGEDVPAGNRLVRTFAGVEYAFRWCPAGEFMMGCGERHDREKPVHNVIFTRGFWMLETQVTQKMWKSIMGSNPSHFKGDDLPVECVSWNDCQDFCKKLSAEVGVTLTLPTEAQWEYACRAGTTGPYAGGLDEMAWYGENSCSTTHKVGLKEPNGWGLCDMHGNVWEWCQDWFGDYPESPTEDPTGPINGKNRVYRGGSCGDGAGYCWSASRGCGVPTSSNNCLGLRLLLIP